MATIEEELQTAPILNSFKRVHLSILYTANVFQNKQRQLLEPFGISGTQYNVLRILRGQCSQCLPTYSIKNRMVERNCDATRVVDRLLTAGLVIREACPNDKRSTLVKITELGLELLEKIEPVLEGHHKLEGLTLEEADQLCLLLDKCRANSAEQDQQPPSYLFE
jgi:DNA-binding MarR family transcriptional regulator